MKPTRGVLVLITLVATVGGRPTTTSAQDVQAIIEAAWDQFRGQASIARVEMTIHRPSWERRMTLKSWTQGRTKSLIYIIAPAKDKGNGTLKKDHKMWLFNPKVNRVIPLPPAMMGQAWMGSDFSNNDLAKSDSLLQDYTHTIISTEMHEGRTVYVIKSIPKPDAPVVWGMQKLKIREDHILLSEEFFDEDLQPVRLMTTSDIQMMGGRLFPKVWKMQKTGSDDEYTLLNHLSLEFPDRLPDRMFTINHLRRPGKR